MVTFICWRSIYQVPSMHQILGFPLPLWNTGTKASWRGKGLFYLRCPSLKTVRTGTQTGWESVGRSRCRSQERLLLTELLWLISLLSYRTQHHQSRGGPTHCGPLASNTKKMPYRFTYNLWVHFLNCSFLLRWLYLLSNWHKSYQYNTRGLRQQCLMFAEHITKCAIRYIFCT